MPDHFLLAFAIYAWAGAACILIFRLGPVTCLVYAATMAAFIAWDLWRLASA